MDKDINNKVNPYINKDNQPELHKSIVVFIDIMGFKSLVKDAKDKGKSQELFIDFHRVVSTWFNRIEEMKGLPSFSVNRKDNYRIRIFTDCFLIGCPIKKGGHRYNFIEGSDEFFDVLSMIQLFQSEMINQGYFVRGAIAVDELYMDDVIIYGNGVTEAYETESKKAKFPRIVLAESAKDLFMEIEEGFIKKGEKNFLSHFINKDSDKLTVSVGDDFQRDNSRSQDTADANPFLSYPSLTELSVHFQKSIPSLIFNSHIYSDDPTARRVMINNIYLREGQRIEGMTIHAIGEFDILLEKNTELFTLPVLRDWQGV